MTNASILSIDTKIEALIKDKTPYNFVQLKEKVEAILKSEDIFLNDNQLQTKAFDMYFNIVITQRNKREKEDDTKIILDSKITKYGLIEQICQKLEFDSNEEVIKKVEELEKKSLTELQAMNSTF